MKSCLPRILGLLLLGAVHALSFAPGPLPAWCLPFVQIFALAVLAAMAFGSSSPRRAAAAGFWFGLADFSVGLYWLYISMHSYGGLAAVLAAAAVLLLAAGLSLFTALAAAVSRWLSGRHLHGHADFRWQLLIAAVWASAWAATEWLRGTLFTGFPWLNIGYAHVEGVLASWAPVVGVYGVAWLSAFASGAIALMARARNGDNDASAAVALAAAIVIGLAGILLGHVVWFKPHGQPMIVRLVQGAVPQSEKFDPELMNQGIETYLRLAALPPKAGDGEPDLIVLPETVMPVFQDRIAPQVWEQWLEIARARGADILMGIPLHKNLAGRDRYTNSAIVIDRYTPLSALGAGALRMHYDKHHLVPFGEFVPTGFHWFIDLLQIPLGDFDRGAPRQPLFVIDGQNIAPDICYEDLFGEEIIQSVRDSELHGPGANILVNMSNLGWFGNSWALRQHLQIARMRALETARPMLAATNTGTTAAIAPDGSVGAALPPLRKGILDVEVQGTTGLTPYVRWGNVPVLIWTGLLLLLGLALRKYRPGGPESSVTEDE
ncbi:apolipoprotein N-acyltransferase [Candidimonas humi]|uniref:Apolipoprotein N-acyltransferase n=1 Tax=Candidimonas humi TaxID=683355 RepID=A0ABV8NXC8_9BURK|nr:apolipoprotein N-acyltransferase [Candidimonas humi]